MVALNLLALASRPAEDVCSPTICPFYMVTMNLLVLAPAAEEVCSPTMSIMME